MTPRLTPLLPPDALYPADAAFMARTDLVETRMLGYTPYNLDAVTTLMVGLMGARPTVRHVAGVTDEILALFDLAGIACDEDIRRYRTGDEAEAHADRLIAEGYRLTAPYPLPDGRYPEAALLVPRALWLALNAKSGLHTLAPPGTIAGRRTASLAALATMAFDRPVWIKSAGDAPTGWGFAVRRCDSAGALRAAADDLRAMGAPDAIIVEDDIPVGTTWCMGIAVDDSATRPAGWTAQVFTSPGRQAGSLIDPENPPPPAAEALALAVGEAARARGFRGLAGLDIGATAEGRVFVFDPNFRINASSAQALFHPAAAARTGLAASVSVGLSAPLPFAAMAARLRGPIAEGWFVPTRMLDAAHLPAAEGRSVFTGFALGATAAEAGAARDRLAALLD